MGRFMLVERCEGCGQYVGPKGQWGAVAPNDKFGDPDYDLAKYVCSERCAKTVRTLTGWSHWCAA